MALASTRSCRFSLCRHSIVMYSLRASLQVPRSQLREVMQSLVAEPQMLYQTSLLFRQRTSA